MSALADAQISTEAALKNLAEGMNELAAAQLIRIKDWMP